MRTLDTKRQTIKDNAIKVKIKSVIPARFIKYKIEDQMFFDGIYDNSLFITGNVGTGKSVFAANIMKKYIKDNLKIQEYDGDVFVAIELKVGWANYPELIAEMRSSFSKKAESTAWELAEKLAHTDKLIVIDDFGAESTTSFVRDITYFIINHRYLKEYPTIFTSNVELDSIEDRIASRILGMCKPIRFDGKDRRY